MRASVRAARHEVGRQEVVRVAKELFASEGVHNTPLSRLAGELGVTTAALYHYFPSRQQLVSEVVMSAVEACTIEVMVPREGLPARATLESWGQTYLQHAEHDALLDFRLFFRVMLDELGDPEIQKLYDKYFDDVRNEIAGALRSGVKSGELTSEIDVRVAAQFIIDAITGIHILWLRDPEGVSLRDGYGTALDAIFAWLTRGKTRRTGD